MDREIDLRKERNKLVEEKDLKKVLFVPGDLQFTNTIDSCFCLEPEYEPEHLVGIDSVVQQCLSVILRECPKATHPTGSFRKPSLGISRMGRGGKSTILYMLFKALKESNLNVNPVYITFNGNFILRDGESQKQAILRLIASQLVTTNLSDPIDLVCDERYLEKYIAESGRPFILLIDDLNMLGCPLRSDAALLLRRMFLDPADRYLVFSTHLYLTVDSTVDALGKYIELPSPRELILANMPESFNITELRAISPDCRDLTVEEAQYYGGIPSLIFCSKTKQRDISPDIRFKRFINLVKVFTEPRLYIERVINCLFTGNVIDEPEDVKLLGVFATTSNYGKAIRARWPLVYISLIVNFLHTLSKKNPDLFVLHRISSLFDDYERDMLTVGSGKGWQT
jgi:hypothetical protein